MALYLSLDGVDDNIVTPSISFDEIIVDASFEQKTGVLQYYWDNLSTSAIAYLRRQTTNVDSRGSYYFGQQVNGVNQTNNTAFVPNNTRAIIRLWGADTTDTVYFFSSKTSSSFMKGNVYSIKLLLNGVIKAHYNMSTGTVQDQSGNGNHATLNGGTWLDDGAGGSTGTDGSTLFDFKQTLYRDASTLMDSKLSMYADSSLSVDIKQAFYQDGSLAVDSKQLIYNDSSFQTDTKQTIYQDTSTLFDTLQEFFSDGIVGSVPFDIRLLIYNDNVTTFDSRQSLYVDGVTRLDLEQKLYALGLSNVDLKLVVYNNSNVSSDIRQQIYKDNIDLFDLNQSLFIDGNVPFDLQNELYQQTFISSDLRQSIYQDNAIEFPLLQQIYATGNIDLDTLQMILDGFSEYQQVLSYVLKIVQKSNYNININDLPMNYQLGIVQKLQSDLELAGSKKSFDLKI